MSCHNVSFRRLLVLGALSLAIWKPALAEKPESKKDSGPDTKRSPGKRPGDGGAGRQGEAVRPGSYFRDEHRVAIRDYYGREYGPGKRCPPGLAKKANGCLPPGQAKKWMVGRVLPRDVVYYALPPAVLTQLGPPPAGHKFVRIAGDILLIAIGTGMVIDAIEDLGR